MCFDIQSRFKRLITFCKITAWDFREENSCNVWSPCDSRVSGQSVGRQRWIDGEKVKFVPKKCIYQSGQNIAVHIFSLCFNIVWHLLQCAITQDTFTFSNTMHACANQSSSSHQTTRVLLVELVGWHSAGKVTWGTSSFFHYAATSL